MLKYTKGLTLCRTSGNWKSTTKTNGNQTTTEARKYSAADKITKIGSKAAKHDAKGNLTKYEQNGKKYTVSYDLDNRITTAKVGTSKTMRLLLIYFLISLSHLCFAQHEIKAFNTEKV